MYANYRFFVKAVFLCIVISLIFPVFSFASSSTFVWSDDDATSMVSSDIASRN